jgi:hypothetical protein
MNLPAGPDPITAILGPEQTARVLHKKRRAMSIQFEEFVTIMALL